MQNSLHRPNWSQSIPNMDCEQLRCGFVIYYTSVVYTKKIVDAYHDFQVKSASNSILKVHWPNALNDHTLSCEGNQRTKLFLQKCRPTFSIFALRLFFTQEVSLSTNNRFGPQKKVLGMPNVTDWISFIQIWYVYYIIWNYFSQLYSSEMRSFSLINLSCLKNEYILYLLIKMMIPH